MEKPRRFFGSARNIEDGGSRTGGATVRVDTPEEVRYYVHGGILPYVLRRLVGRKG